MKKVGFQRSRLVGLLAATVALVAPLGALPPLGLRVSPELRIPLGNPSSVVKDGKVLDLYSPGFGLELTADLRLFDFLSPYLETGISSLPLNGVAGSALFTAQGGAGLSLQAYPLTRLMIRGGGGGGLSWIDSPSADKPGLGYYWKVQGELGWRFSPGLVLLGSTSYSQVLGSAGDIFAHPIYKGLSAGLLLSLGLDSLGRGSGIGIRTLAEGPIFPIAYYKSEKTPLATLVLKNGESAEIRDVKVSFSAGAYTSRAASCAIFPLVRQGGEVEVPIYAAFNDRVLGFTELTKIQGEVRIEYAVLDAKRTRTMALPIVFNNRNAATWADPDVVGAFVSPQDPVMLELSKYLAGLVRLRARPEIDKNLQYGMGLFEGLRLFGLSYAADPNLPYASARAAPGKAAYIQYPYQTLSYKSGDSDALALVIAEALESVAVPAAVAALPEEVLVAFPLDMNEAQARTSFAQPANFIFEGGRAWVPLRPSMIRDGFLRAWIAGAELWRSQPASPAPVLIHIEEAWKSYTPISLADVDFKPQKPAEEAVYLAFENALGRFVATEVEPKAQRILSSMSNGGTGRQRNSLGILYAQYGIYDKARSEFEKAVALAFAPAVANLANVAFLLKDYETAATWFEKSLAQNPDNKAALIGLARSRYELDDYVSADALFAKVRALDASLADRYSYLSSKVDVGSALRASAAAADRGGGMTWDLGE